MGKKTRKANNAFLLGSIILMVLLLLVVVLFIFAAFKIYDKKSDYSQDQYVIVLDESTLNSPMSLYMNDSLLFSGTPASQMTITVGRFADESSLLVVDTQSDNVSILELPEGSAKVTVVRQGTEFTLGK